MASDFPHDAVPSGVTELCARLRDAGYRAWIVGGCVRDLLLGRRVVDWDVATSARPEQVKATFRRVIPTGIDHGTVTVMRGDEGYEVTTLRGDGAYSDGRRPDEVTFVDDIADDLARRDFTVNAIAYEPTSKALVDPHGGLADLEARLLRAVGEPAQRFGEDGLRILRGARFVATLGFELEAETEAAFEGALDVYAKVSPERVREEWLKATRAERPSPAFEVMARTGILARTCAPLAELDEVAFALSLRALDASAAHGAERLAALLHRIGLARGADAATYAATSADLAGGWLRDYRFSNAERRTITGAIAHHRTLLGLDPSDDRAIRRVLSVLGRADYHPALRLAQAVGHAEGRDSLDSLETALARTAQSNDPLAIGDLAIGGREVIACLGGGGRQVGQVLQALLDRALDDPSLNEASALTALAREIARALPPVRKAQA